MPSSCAHDGDKCVGRSPTYVAVSATQVEAVGSPRGGAILRGRRDGGLGLGRLGPRDARAEVHEGKSRHSVARCYRMSASVTQSHSLCCDRPCHGIALLTSNGSEARGCHPEYPQCCCVGLMHRGRRVVTAARTRSSCLSQAHPGVPVVDNLEDIWRVSKLQRERKAEAEAMKKAHLARMRVRHRWRLRPSTNHTLRAACHEMTDSACTAL